MQFILAIAIVMQIAPSYAERFRLWASNGDEISVVVYRVPIEPETHALGLQLQQQDSSGTVRSESTWTVALDHSDAPTVSGFVVATRKPEFTMWSLGVRHDTAATGFLGGRQFPREDGGVMLSDLVLGATSHAVRWEHDGQVTLLPLPDSIRPSDTVRVFYQVRSRAAHADVITTLTFTDVTNPKQGHLAMRLQSRGGLEPGINPFERAIDVSHLTPGRYLLELGVGDLSGGGSSVRPASFVVAAPAGGRKL